MPQLPAQSLPPGSSPSTTSWLPSVSAYSAQNLFEASADGTITWESGENRDLGTAVQIESWQT